MTNPTGIPWYRSRGMVSAYVGLAIAFVDVLSTLMLSQDLSWRTGVLALVAGLGAWTRKNATQVVVSWLGLEGGNEQ